MLAERLAVDAFLAGHAEFSRVPAREILQRQGIALDTGVDLALDPAHHGTDGFYASALLRAPRA